MRPPSGRDEGERPADAEAVLRALRNPRAAAKAFIKFDAERSLLNYVKLMWHVVEPGQPLVVNWTMAAMCEQLEAISLGQITRWLGNVPPGFSKSSLVGVFWPTWEWGPRDRSDLRMISWSYAGHLTERDNEKGRNIIESPLYRSLWSLRRDRYGNRISGFELDAKQNTKTFYKTTQKGFRIATSIDGVGTGERADRLTFDDPHSVSGGDSEADLRKTINFFGGTFNSRIRNADTVVKVIDGMRAEPSTIAIVMQRVHVRDVSGAIIANELGYEHFMVEQEYEGSAHPLRKKTNWRPALGFVDPREKVCADIAKAITLHEMCEVEWRDWWWGFGRMWLEIAHDLGRLADPVRFPRHVLERDKKIMLLKQGTNAVASQFRQWPFDTTGALFKREWFTEDRFVSMAQVGESMNDVRAWDLAASVSMKGDRTATVLMRMTNDRKLYVLHAEARRASPGGVEDWIRERVQLDGSGVKPSIPIDPAQAGKSQIHTFAKSIFMGVEFDATREVKDKRKRATPLAAQAEHANLYLVRAPWNEEFLDELCSFPVGDHDDLVDAASRAYDVLIRLMDDGESYTPRIHTGD